MIEKITRGDSSRLYEFSVEEFPDISSLNWIGRKGVVRSLGETPLINEAIEKDSESTKFLGFLTPEETSSLEPGRYLLIFELQNLSITPPYREEFKYKIKIEEQGLV